MQWDKVKLFGFRVTVEKVEERVGRIVVPENRQVLYQIGRVVCVGDCTQPDGTKEESLVALGDLVYFQTNAMMAAYQQYERDGKSYLNLHQGDLIARLSSNVIRYENFEPLGRWIIAEPFVRQTASGILLPDTAKQTGHLFFKAVKIGSRAKIEVQPDQEVILNTGRINTLFMNRLDIANGEDKLTELVYVDRDFVLGTVGEPGENSVVTA